MNPGRLVARLTRQSHSNFFYAFVLLPRAKREAMFAVYAFCRIVDDVVDTGGAGADPRTELARWRADLARVFDGAPEHPVAQRLQEMVHVFPLPQSALEDILAGVDMDLDRATYETFEELYTYCYRVASAVGLCTIVVALAYRGGVASAALTDGAEIPTTATRTDQSHTVTAGLGLGW